MYMLFTADGHMSVSVFTCHVSGQSVELWVLITEFVFLFPLHKERETKRIEVYEVPCRVFHIEKMEGAQIEMACGFRRAAISPAGPHSGHIGVTVG